jgi:hypothetical protein
MPASFVPTASAERGGTSSQSKGGSNEQLRWNEALKRELRKLRTLGLIKNSKYIQEIRDNATFDLRDFVELTERGLQYLTRFKDYKD